MAFELEALVGHLYIVSGRAIKTAPPGALIEVAPRKAARGREADTFFTLVLPGGEETAPAAFYEQLAEFAAEKFFSASGSVTAALRSVFHSLNENLYEHNANESSHYEASIVIGVLRGMDLYLARVGSGVALLKHELQVQPFPGDFDNDEVLFAPPLGVQPVPVVKMANYHVSSGSRLLIGDAHLADLEMPQLVAALAADDIAGVLTVMKGFVPLQMTLMALEFVSPEVDTTIPVRAAETSRATASATRPPASVQAAAAGTSSESESEGSRRLNQRGVPLPALEVAGAGARALAGGADSAVKLIDRLLPTPSPDKPRWFASPAAAGTAVVIPILVVMVVVIMWVSGTGASEFDQCVQRAEEAADIARNVASSDVQGTISAWSGAAALATECQRLRPDVPDDSLSAISAESQTIVDHLMVISRRQMSIVASFPQAGLTHAILQGQDLFVLDDGNDQVYRITLTPDGMGMEPNTRQALAYMRRNVQLDEYQVGDLIDITWAEDGSGFSQSNVIVALDSNGLVIDCPPRFSDTCRAQQLQSTENWIDPVAITVWNGRLYVLDPGANQLWRYDPNAGAFANAPIEYFSGEGRPDIRQAVDFSIDTEGVVYILLSYGTVVKFRGGDRLDFAFAGFPQGQALTSVNAFYLNTNPLQPGLYIVSREAHAVYETLLGGTFVHNFRAENEAYFDSIADVVYNNAEKVIYTLSGNSVFAFKRDVAE
ncbi:MAG: hypothetical protein KC547_00340 [Anaerolineae bacterium]|nr:hypothetical protein [Anaerolineae bacterium]